ncbi:M-phase phosphoprotein 6 [Neolecta irregularis DAH-3]|uniref:M-phase phosphoprotein 6 n=1 Tax=Neolecta irregularis (strain DAH-3) TaxID=1198029 RepID=A0A1U7LK83_NEOID|nr:M-phase phosphoprotein 6 [Neolecta irregularis DAH-3]|eukprot:OLL22931.1 M-phase phosphoprotein 6 [Neolecta irregularis DAH-3]
MTSREEPKEAGLSAKVMSMKFMQRAQDAEERKRVEERQEREYSEAHWHLTFVEGKEEKRDDKVVYEPSYGAFEEDFGRVSGRVKFGLGIEDEASEEEMESEEDKKAEERAIAKKLRKMTSLSGEKGDKRGRKK